MCWHAFGLHTPSVPFLEISWFVDPKLSCGDSVHVRLYFADSVVYQDVCPVSLCAAYRHAGNHLPVATVALICMLQAEASRFIMSLCTMQTGIIAASVRQTMFLAVFAAAVTRGVWMQPVLLRRTKSSTIDGEPVVKLPPREQLLVRKAFSLSEQKFYDQVQAESMQKLKVCVLCFLYCTVLPWHVCLAP